MYQVSFTEYPKNYTYHTYIQNNSNINTYTRLGESWKCTRIRYCCICTYTYSSIYVEKSKRRNQRVRYVYLVYEYLGHPLSKLFEIRTSIRNLFETGNFSGRISNLYIKKIKYMYAYGMSYSGRPPSVNGSTSGKNCVRKRRLSGFYNLKPWRVSTRRRRQRWNKSETSLRNHI